MRKFLLWRAESASWRPPAGRVVVTVGWSRGSCRRSSSVLDHLRRSYHPRDTVLVRTATARSTVSRSADPSDEPPDLEPGLVVYRFGANLYYANANRLTSSRGRHWEVGGGALVGVPRGRGYRGRRLLRGRHDIDLSRHAVTRVRSWCWPTCARTSGPSWIATVSPTRSAATPTSKRWGTWSRRSRPPAPDVRAHRTN